MQQSTLGALFVSFVLVLFFSSASIHTTTQGYMVAAIPASSGTAAPTGSVSGGSSPLPSSTTTSAPANNAAPSTQSAPSSNEQKPPETGSSTKCPEGTECKTSTPKEVKGLGDCADPKASAQVKAKCAEQEKVAKAQLSKCTQGKTEKKQCEPYEIEKVVYTSSACLLKAGNTIAKCNPKPTDECPTVSSTTGKVCKWDSNEPGCQCGKGGNQNAQQGGGGGQGGGQSGQGVSPKEVADADQPRQNVQSGQNNSANTGANAAFNESREPMRRVEVDGKPTYIKESDYNRYVQSSGDVLGQAELNQAIREGKISTFEPQRTAGADGGAGGFTQVTQGPASSVSGQGGLAGSNQNSTSLGGAQSGNQSSSGATGAAGSGQSNAPTAGSPRPTTVGGADRTPVGSNYGRSTSNVGGNQNYGPLSGNFDSFKPYQPYANNTNSGLGNLAQNFAQQQQSYGYNGYSGNTNQPVYNGGYGNAITTPSSSGVARGGVTGALGNFINSLVGASPTPEGVVYYQNQPIASYRTEDGAIVIDRVRVPRQTPQGVATDPTDLVQALAASDVSVAARIRSAVAGGSITLAVPTNPDDQNQSFANIENLIVQDEVADALRVAEDAAIAAKDSLACEVEEAAQDCLARRLAAAQEVERRVFVDELNRRALSNNAVAHFVGLYDGVANPNGATSYTSSVPSILSQLNQQQPKGIVGTVVDAVGAAIDATVQFIANMFGKSAAGAQ